MTKGKVIRYSVPSILTLAGAALGIVLLGREIVLLVGFLFILGGLYQVHRTKKQRELEKRKLQEKEEILSELGLN